MVLVSGSIIASNLLNLEETIRLSEDNGLDWLHFDVMDGHFVPNLTIGFDIIKLAKKFTNLPLDVHLMVQNPEKFIDIIDYCDMIDFHVEATAYPIRLIEKIKSRKEDIRVGIAVNPITSVDFLDYLEDMIDNILIMTVEPGFSHQKFIYNVIKKIEKVSEIISKWKNKPFLSVDGGINENNYKIVIEKGANYIVCGSFIYKDYNEIREKIIKIKKGEGDNYAS
jgi:ribulose-phosphate 3-epimerase